MKHLFTLLMLAVCFGLNLNAQQLKPQAPLSHVVSQKVSQQKDLQKPVNSPIHKRIRDKQEIRSLVLKSSNATDVTDTHVKLYTTDEDVALEELTGPVSSMNLTNSESVSVLLSNQGVNAFSSIELSYQINDGAAVTETCTQTVQPGAFLTYTFATKADFSAKGVYKVTVSVAYDQITGYVKHTPLSLPFVSKFDSPEEIAMYWTVIDGNEDGFSWFYNDGITDADGGVGSMCIIANDDDYLVSEALNFPSEDNYQISFQVKSDSYTPFQKESFRILYGTSPDPASMTVLADYPAFDLFNKWMFVVNNLTITTPGAYYFAIHYYSDDKGIVLYLDNVAVEAGSYDGVPDLAIRKVELPASACDLSSESPVKVTLTNVGTSPANKYLIVTQLDGDIMGTYQIIENLPIEVMQSVTITLDHTVDLSEVGEHSLRVVASAEGELNRDNNVLEVFVTHYEPLTTLPFKSDFSEPGDEVYWIPGESYGWMTNANKGTYYPLKENVALFSRCISLPVGDYRFSFTYFAGYEDWSGDIMGDDFYVAYGKSGTDPLSWEPVKEYSQACTWDKKVTDEFILHITEADDYSIAFVSTLQAALLIYNTSLTVVSDHDICVAKVDLPASLARQTPKYHVSGEKQFSVTVQNRGKNAETGKFEIKLGDEVLGQNTVHLDAVDGSDRVSLAVTLPALPEGPFTLKVSASIDNQTDANPADNTLVITKFVSDSTFVWDSIDADFQKGVGFRSPSAFGLVYTLDKADLLTSINIGFYEQPENHDDFGIAVYPYLEDGTLGNPIFTQEQPRPTGGSSITFDVPDTPLGAGAYCFVIQQLTSNDIAVACDRNPEGGFYMIASDNKHTFYFQGEEEGCLHIRPNFGKYGQVAVPVVRTETQVSLYPNPVSDVLTVSAAGQTIEQLSISDITGKTVYRTNQVNASSYTMNVNQLPSGIYFVSVQTALGVTASKLVVK